jgi:predicted HicB family RNase H-like nuclease
MKKQATPGVRFHRATRRAAGSMLQYTVRNIPEHVDRALRRKASEERKSLNEVLRDALIREARVFEPASRL